MRLSRINMLRFIQRIYRKYVDWPRCQTGLRDSLIQQYRQDQCEDGNFLNKNTFLATDPSVTCRLTIGFARISPISGQPAVQILPDETVIDQVGITGDHRVDLLGLAGRQPFPFAERMHSGDQSAALENVKDAGDAALK